MKRKYINYKCDCCGFDFSRRSDYKNKNGNNCIACSNIIAGKKRKTHGLNDSNSRLHVTWSNMKRRCLNPTEKEKINYKGVKLVDEWMDFIPFMNWAISNGYSKNKTIDRANGNGNYEPSNCRFVDINTQNANRRITSRNKSGYIGVSASGGRWRADVRWKDVRHSIGTYFDKYTASMERDRYVIENGLPHALNHNIAKVKAYCETHTESKKFTAIELRELRAELNKQIREIE